MCRAGLFTPDPDWHQPGWQDGQISRGWDLSVSRFQPPSFRDLPLHDGPEVVEEMAASAQPKRKRIENHRRRCNQGTLVVRAAEADRAPYTGHSGACLQPEADRTNRDQGRAALFSEQYAAAHL